MSSHQDFPEQSISASISYKIANRLQIEKKRSSTLSSTNMLTQWVLELLGRARKSVNLDAPEVRIFIQVYNPHHERAVRILKLPKNLLSEIIQ